MFFFPEESAGQKVEEAGESVRQSRDTVGQNVDEGILEARKKGTQLSKSTTVWDWQWLATAEEKVEELGENIRQRRETVGSTVDEGIGTAKETGARIRRF